MLTISRGHRGLGEKDGVVGLADSMTGVEAGIWCRMSSNKASVLSKREEGKDAYEKPALPAKRRRSEDATASPATFGAQGSGSSPAVILPPASPNFSLSGHGDVFANPASSSVKKQVRHGDTAIQPNSFQPIHPHAPLFKDNSPGTRDSDSSLLKTPDGWHTTAEDGVVGIGGSPLILPPDTAFKLEGRQSTDWEPFPRSGSRDTDRAASVTKSFETPFELCCITPTHSLFSSNEKARPRRSKAATPPSVPKAEILASSPAVPMAMKPNSEIATQTQAAYSDGTSGANAKTNGTMKDPAQDKAKRKSNGITSSKVKNGKFGDDSKNETTPSPFTAVPTSRKSEVGGHSSASSPLRNGSSSLKATNSKLPPMGPPDNQHWSDENHSTAQQSRETSSFQLSQHHRPANPKPGSEPEASRPPLSKDKERRSARYKGVTWDRVKRMWRVRLCLQGGARQHVGYYQDEEEGAIAYVNALSAAKAQGLSLKQDSLV